MTILFLSELLINVTPFEWLMKIYALLICGDFTKSYSSAVELPFLPHTCTSSPPIPYGFCAVLFSPVPPFGHSEGVV